VEDVNISMQLHLVSPNFGDFAVSLDSFASTDNSEKNFFVLFLITLSNGLDYITHYSMCDRVRLVLSFVSLLGKKKMNSEVHLKFD